MRIRLLFVINSLAAPLLLRLTKNWKYRISMLIARYIISL